MKRSVLTVTVPVTVAESYGKITEMITSSYGDKHKPAHNVHVLNAVS